MRASCPRARTPITTSGGAQAILRRSAAIPNRRTAARRRISTTSRCRLPQHRPRSPRRNQRRHRPPRRPRRPPPAPPPTATAHPKPSANRGTPTPTPTGSLGQVAFVGPIVSGQGTPPPGAGGIGGGDGGPLGDGPIALLLAGIVVPVGAFAGWWLVAFRRRRRAPAAEVDDESAEAPREPRDQESMPRWLRPSVREARYAREGTGTEPRALVFGSEPDSGVDRRLMRFDLVPLFASIDQEQPPVLAQLKVHDEVEVLDQNGPWLRVRTPVGTEGWVPESRVSGPLSEEPAASSSPADATPALAPSASSNPSESPFLQALAAVHAAKETAGEASPPASQRSTRRAKKADGPPSDRAESGTRRTTTRRSRPKAT